MKVTNDNQPPPLQKFRLLEVGDPFLYDGALCMRVVTANSVINYVNVESGYCGSISAETEVRTVEVALSYGN